MKDLKIAGLLMIAVTAFISCQKEQTLVNKIEGTYKMEKVVYIENNRESVVSIPNSIMFFDDCKLNKQVLQACNGYYEMEGQNRITFDYLPEKNGSKEKMQINIGDFSLKPYFGGSYTIEDRTEKSLVLVRQSSFFGNITDLRIFLKK